MFDATQKRDENLVSRYLTAKEVVVQSGYAREIDWQEQRRLENVTESSFLLECAWVILNSGMRESVVRQRFPLVTRAFLNWSSASEILGQQQACRRRAIAAFGHIPKIDAIVRTAGMLVENGIDKIKRRIKVVGVPALLQFPFIGPVTAWHLAKNIGLDVAKPDRHLCRISEIAGFSSPSEMCKLIARHVGDRLSVVDVVLWRFATLQHNYLKFFNIQLSERNDDVQLDSWEGPTHRGQRKLRLCA